MASDISSGGSSEFLATRKFFRANCSNTKEEVEVFVENKFDSIFWRHFFTKYETDKLFKIRVLKCDDNELCGKSTLIEHIKLESLGPNKLIAIDSDYDYIIDNYHPYSQKLKECKYVLHTNDTYSIENHKIVPSILKEAIYLTSLCDIINDNIENIILETSKILYNLFTIHLFSTYKQDDVYPLSKFKSDLQHLTYQNDTITNTITINHKTKIYITKKVGNFKSYIKNNNSEYNTFLNQLKSKGVNDFNCWQYMNGHEVLDNIGIKIVTKLTTKYRAEYFKWINSHITNETRKNELLVEFKNFTHVDDNTHTLKDRIREILCDIKPNLEWEPSILIINQIKTIFQ